MKKQFLIAGFLTIALGALALTSCNNTPSEKKDAANEACRKPKKKPQKPKKT